MCIIIDANRLSEFAKQDSARTKRLLKFVLELGELDIVIGGSTLSREYARVSDANSLIRELERTGKVVKARKSEVDEKERWFCQQQTKSNDPHILAIADVSGARLLFTEDSNLEDDFKSKRLIDSPRGKIYKQTDHEHLFDDACDQC